MGAALDFTVKQLGGLVLEQESNPSISTSPVVVVPNNPDRVALVMVNLGAGNVFVSLANVPSASAGIFLGASGGSVTLNVRDDMTLPSRQWSAICPAGGPSVLEVIEYIRQVEIPQLPAFKVQQ